MRIKDEAEARPARGASWSDLEREVVSLRAELAEARSKAARAQEKAARAEAKCRYAGGAARAGLLDTAVAMAWAAYGSAMEPAEAVDDDAIDRHFDAMREAHPYLFRSEAPSPVSLPPGAAGHIRSTAFPAGSMWVGSVAVRLEQAGGGAQWQHVERSGFKTEAAAAKWARLLGDLLAGHECGGDDGHGTVAVADASRSEQAKREACPPAST